MRVVGWGAVIGLGVGLVTTANAGVFYRYRTSSGAIVLSSTPIETATRWLIIRRVRARPTAPRTLVPGTNAAVPTGQRSPAPVPTSYDELIRDVASRYGVEYALVKAVIKAESDFNRLAVSPKGARGLMQLMPETAAQHLVGNVFLPRENIEAGCGHLRELFDRYGDDLELVLAAYNAGVRRVDECGGVPPIPETRVYLARVLRYRLGYEEEVGGSTTSACTTTGSRVRCG